MDGAGTDSAFWSGELEAGDHDVVVERDSPAAGGYSLTVTATETMAAVAAPLAGGPAFVVVARICVVKEYGDTTEKTCHHTFFYTLFDVTNVTGNDTGPPEGAGPGEGPEGPDDGGGGGGGGGGEGGTEPTPSGNSLAAATSDINCEGWNIDADDGFDALRPDGEGGTRPHGAIDIQVSSDDASFFALEDGSMTSYASSRTCDHQIAVRLPSGGRHVYCQMDEDDRLAAGTEVRTGDRIGSYGPSGVTSGPHLHLKVTGPDNLPIDPIEDAGGQSVMVAAGFTFNSSDSEHCAEEW